MSNLTALMNLARRAQEKADNSISLLENMPITTNCGVVLFAAKRIGELETALLDANTELTELRKLRDEVSVSYKSIETGNHPLLK